jgi:hypothetical protein
VPKSKGYSVRVWCSDACRKRASRRVVVARSSPEQSEVAIVPGDTALVGAVQRLVDGLEITTDEEAAQAELALELAGMVSAGSVPAARELRLALLELRAISDPDYEGPITQATKLKIWIEGFGGSGEGTLDRPCPPGWTSTATDGEILTWLGRRWYELRDGQNYTGLQDLLSWVGAHAAELRSLREDGRWTVWPDVRNSL